MESGIPPEIYEKILQAVSRFFYLYESNRTKSQKTEEVVQEYQDKYRNIYHLLTEKTNLDESRKAESETLKALIGIILDQMNIVCCTLNPDMTLSSANASMLKLCKAEETDIFKKPRIEDFFPSLLRDIFYELLNTTEHQTEIGSHQVVVTSSGDTSWCLIRSPDPKDRSIIYIGEKDPAALIQYILMYEYRNCSRASTRRISG
jgi:PAS domain-containing protein